MRTRRLSWSSPCLGGTARAITGVLVLLVSLTAPSLTRAHEGHAALPSKGLTVQGNQLLLSAGARQAIDLKTAKISLADMTRLVTCNVRVELPWHRQAMITTQVSGRIERVFVHPGETVESGQRLARVESLELESLQLAMLQADAELSLVKELSQRQAALAEQGVIAGKSALETQTSLRQKNAELEIAVCKLRALGLEKALLDKIRQTRKPIIGFTIVSPITGTVAEADVRVGQVVKTTEHLYHVVDLSTVWGYADVLEGDVSAVRDGQSATITLKALPGRSFQGRTRHLHLKMDEKRRTRSVVVALDNREKLLRPGMFGRMEIEIARSKEAIVCPADGIIENVGRDYVLLSRGEGKYIRQPVTVGIRNHRQVEILDGLFPGDQVVISGKHVLFSLFGGQRAENENRRSVSERRRERQRQLAAIVDPRQMPPNHGTIVVQGTVELPTQSKVFASSRIEGRIARILVNHSELIRAGQVLAEVESLQLRNLQSDLLETQAKLNWTIARVRRLESLAGQRLTSKKELWQLQTDERVLSSQAASATRTLTMVGVPEEEIDRLLKTDLSAEDCELTLVRTIPIRAAIAGAVADFDILPGQVVAAQSTLFEIHDASKVWVKGYVFQRDAVHVRTKQEASLTFSAHPGFAVSGTVIRISPVLSKSERVLPVWVEVNNPDGRLIEGMLARMEIKIDTPSIAMASDRRTAAQALRQSTE